MRTTAITAGEAAAPVTLWRCAGRQCGAGECVHDEHALHRQAPPSVHRVLAAPGTPLTPGVRIDAERRLRHDFGSVRVHTGRDAAMSARAVRARAYTVGQHVVLGEHAARGGSAAARRTLYHELAHAMRSSGHGGALSNPLLVSSPDHPAEREAHRIADQALHGRVPAGATSLNQGAGRPGPDASLLMRDFAVEPLNPVLPGERLDDEQVLEAIRYNALRYFDAAEIELLRDVLGIRPTPAVIDRDFVHAVARYQQQFGEAVDGKLGRASADVLTRELTAEGEASAATELGVRGRATERRRNIDSGGKSDIFDAELDHANARLTLVMRIQFNFIAGGGGAWPSVGAQNAWRNSFIQRVHGRWNYRLLMRRRGLSDRYLRYYATRVRIQPSSSAPHYTANVSFETSHTTSSVSAGTNAATFDVLDVNPISYTFGARTYTRTTSEHEFGHMLGLDHVACNSNSAACYGTTHATRRNIMGYGGAVSVTNATPFLDAMRAITGQAWDAVPLRRLT